jgi:hypothetical protein
MRALSIGVMAVITMAVIEPVSAQVLLPGAPQPSPAAAYPVQRYPFPSVTPEDAYREGLINRWQLEQYQGPTPQALQGPSPNGGKGSQSGGGGGM